MLIYDTIIHVARTSTLEREVETMKKYEFREYELSEKAFGAYSNSDFIFYEDENGRFFVTDTPIMLGTLQDVEDFLLQFA